MSAADFGFEDDNLDSEQQESPEPSPPVTPRMTFEPPARRISSVAPHATSLSEAVSSHLESQVVPNDVSHKASGSSQKVSLVEEKEKSEDTPLPEVEDAPKKTEAVDNVLEDEAEKARKARIEKDLQLVQQAARPSKASTKEHSRQRHSRKEAKSAAEPSSRANKELECEDERAARIAADLQLLRGSTQRIAGLAR
jgi:hypothetical protein